VARTYQKPFELLRSIHIAKTVEQRVTQQVVIKREEERRRRETRVFGREGLLPLKPPQETVGSHFVVVLNSQSCLFMT